MRGIGSSWRDGKNFEKQTPLFEHYPKRRKQDQEKETKENIGMGLCAHCHCCINGLALDYLGGMGEQDTEKETTHETSS